MKYPFFCQQCEHEIEDVEVEIPTPPPVSSDPSSSAYANPGDAGGIYGLPEECPNCGVKFDEAAELDAALEALRVESDDSDIDDDFIDPRDFDEPDWESPLIRRKL